MTSIWSRLLGRKSDAPVKAPGASDTAYRTIAEQEFLDWLLDGLPSHSLSVPDRLIFQTAAQEVRKGPERMKSVPRLPSVIPVLLAKLRDPDASLNQIAEFVKQDPLVASGVLRMANSAYFNPTGEDINSFQRAVVNLGIAGLRSVLSAAILQPIMMTRDGEHGELSRKLWEFSLVSAVSCQLLARSFNEDPFRAYLVGLIHSVGIITLVHRVQRHYPTDQMPERQALNELLLDLGPSLSYWIATDWNLPQEIIGALSAYNEEGSNSSNRLSQLLYTGSQLARQHALVTSNRLIPECDRYWVNTYRLPENLWKILDGAIPPSAKAQQNALRGRPHGTPSGHKA